MNCVPCLASISMLYPGDGSLDRFSRRAKRSRQLPTAMSIVSPKMRYLAPPIRWERKVREWVSMTLPKLVVRSPPP